MSTIATHSAQALPDEVLSHVLVSAWLVDPHPHLRVTLMSVSRQFREVVVSSAILWSEIWERTPSDRVPLYVRRSRARPIHLHLDLCSIDAMPSASDKIHFIGEQLQRLSIQGNAQNISNFLKLHAMSSVEHFEVRRTRTDPYVAEQLPKKGFEDCTRMKSLTIHDGLCLPRRPILPKALTTLNIHMVPKLNGLLYALSATRKLKHLSIGHTTFSDLTSTKVVHLPDLQSLEASTVVGGNTAALFGSLSFPASTRVSLGLLITRAGVGSLGADIEAATLHLHTAAPVHAVEGFAHGRHYERGTLIVRCFQDSLLGNHWNPIEPIFSLDMWWDNPWPIPHREFAYSHILDSLPLTNVREIALRLSESGAARIAHGISGRPHLGLLQLAEGVWTTKASTLLLCGPTDSIVTAAVNLPSLKRIIALEREWRVADRRRLGRLFEHRSRMTSTCPEVDIELVDESGWSVGNVIERISSSSYISCGGES
ncbi:hypothetical protein PENSPDRAFT_753823 [Peniophora sp. CONT]|nr:hypothetical protein PENSPDRAFT_753823 [Peniophora sp. CONT]